MGGKTANSGEPMSIALVNAVTQRVDRVRTGLRTQVQKLIWNGFDMEYRSTFRGLNNTAHTVDTEARYRNKVNTRFAAAVRSRTRHYANWQPTGV